MTKKRWLLLAFLAAVIVICCACLVACSGGHDDDDDTDNDTPETPAATTYSITWTLDGHAAVTADGYDTLPTSVEENTKISFTVTPSTGYELESVTANGATLTTSTGTYNRTITQNTEFVITTSATITGIKVTTPPSKLTYYAGESLDTTGMVVEADLVAGGTEQISGYTISPETFSLGDTSFTVIYGDFESEEVQLDSAVAALITIDPDGGTISEEYLTALEEMSSEFSSYNADEKSGLITIVHNGLTSAITLPTEDEISKIIDESEFTFVGWNYLDANGNVLGSIDEISQADGNSYTIVADWEITLVSYSNIRLEYTTYNGVTAPYLILTVSFEGVDSAYLYLYEGHSEDTLIGETYTKTGNDTDELYFNLSTLGENETYVSEWMDIRLNAVIGGVEYSQEIEFDPENPIANIGCAVQDDTYSYVLLAYKNDGVYTLKVAFNTYTTTYAYKADTENNTFTIYGTANLNQISGSLDGASVSVDFGSYTFDGTINTNGEWEITVNIKDLDYSATLSNTNYISNFVITSSGGETLMTASQLLYVLATDSYDYSSAFSSPSNFVETFEYDEFTMYAGLMGSDWKEAFYSLYSTYVPVTVTSISFTEDSIVISGTAEDITTLNIYIINIYNSASLDNYQTATISEDGTFTVTFTLESLLELDYPDKPLNLRYTYDHKTASKIDIEQGSLSLDSTVDYEGYNFYLSLNGSCVCVKYTEIPVSYATVTSIEFTTDSIVISGTATGITTLNIYLINTNNAATADNYKSATIGEDGAFTVTFTLDELIALNYATYPLNLRYTYDDVTDTTNVEQGDLDLSITCDYEGYHFYLDLNSKTVCVKYKEIPASAAYVTSVSFTDDSFIVTGYATGMTTLNIYLINTNNSATADNYITASISEDDGGTFTVSFTLQSLIDLDYAGNPLNLRYTYDDVTSTTNVEQGDLDLSAVYDYGGYRFTMTINNKCVALKYVASTEGVVATYVGFETGEDGETELVVTMTAVGINDESTIVFHLLNTTSSTYFDYQAESVTINDNGTFTVRIPMSALEEASAGAYLNMRVYINDESSYVGVSEGYGIDISATYSTDSRTYSFGLNGSTVYIKYVNS